MTMAASTPYQSKKSMGLKSPSNSQKSLESKKGRPTILPTSSFLSPPNLQLPWVSAEYNKSCQISLNLLLVKKI